MASPLGNALGYIPGYWIHETSGVLRPAVEAYLSGNRMTPGQLAAMRAYLRHWIDAPGFQGPGVDDLRELVDKLDSRGAIHSWLYAALEEGIDPL